MNAVPGSLAYSDHLVWLLGRIEAAAARLAGADPERRGRVAQAARREGARLSARLDGSPLPADVADEVDRRLAEGLPPLAELPPVSAGDGGGWAHALKLEGMPTREIAALEYANLLAVAEAEGELAAGLFERPWETLVRLHGLLCAGLVEPAVHGRPRRSELAVHDGAQGQVVFQPPAPERVESLLGELLGWLGRGSATKPAAVVAGVVHERLLEWQPFEAANGRLARCAARLVLRARAIDPWGVAVPERHLITDPLAYHREVAATMRRRGDLTPWLERWAEALRLALEEAVAAVTPAVGVTPSPRARDLVETLAEGEAITLAEYAGRAGVSLETARSDLAGLEQAGLMTLVPGSRGLRWARRRR